MRMTVEELRTSGITSADIAKMAMQNYDIYTGERIDKKVLVQQKIREKVGAAIQKLIEDGANEDDMLEWIQNPYEDENGVSIEKIKEELLKRKQEKSVGEFHDGYLDACDAGIKISSVQEATIATKQELRRTEQNEKKENSIDESKQVGG